MGMGTVLAGTCQDFFSVFCVWLLIGDWLTQFFIIIFIVQLVQYLTVSWDTGLGVRYQAQQVSRCNQNICSLMITLSDRVKWRQSYLLEPIKVIMITSKLIPFGFQKCPRVTPVKLKLTLRLNWRVVFVRKLPTVAGSVSSGIGRTTNPPVLPSPSGSLLEMGGDCLPPGGSRRDR